MRGNKSVRTLAGVVGLRPQGFVGFLCEEDEVFPYRFSGYQTLDVAFPFDFLDYQTQSLIIFLFLFLFKFISKKSKEIVVVLLVIRKG